MAPITRVTRPKLKRTQQAALAHAAVQAEYVEKGSDEALYWLLVNGVRSGMERGEIEEVLGTKLDPAGPIESLDPNFGLEEEDEFYQTGPTRQGWMCLFHMRDGELLKYYTQPPNVDGSDAVKENPVGVDEADSDEQSSSVSDEATEVSDATDVIPDGPLVQ